jgi:peptide deformylase
MWWPFKKRKFEETLVVGNRSLAKACHTVGPLVKDVEKAEKIGAELVIMAKFLEKNHYMSCCGLAANQIGYKKRVITVRRGGVWIVYINPGFHVDQSPSNRVQKKQEGCLSWPNKPLNVRRYRKIWAYGDNQDSKLLTGLEAQAFQHEIDHLNGTMVP